MSIVGFKEAYDSSIEVKLNKTPELLIKIPTLPGLSLLKIISWNEKFPERSKDAEDLLFILNNYEHTGVSEYLYNDENLLIKENFNLKNAAIRLLGREMAKISDSNTSTIVLDILEEETGENSKYRLANNMTSAKWNYDEQFRTTVIKLEKLKQGFIDKY